MMCEKKTISERRWKLFSELSCSMGSMDLTYFMILR